MIIPLVEVVAKEQVDLETDCVQADQLLCLMEVVKAWQPQLNLDLLDSDQDRKVHFERDPQHDVVECKWTSHARVETELAQENAQADYDYFGHEIGAGCEENHSVKKPGCHNLFSFFLIIIN